MTTKKGICMDCGPESAENFLIAGRCQFHYWNHRRKVKQDSPRGKAQQSEENKRKSDLTTWFNLKIQMKPQTCENCGWGLSNSMVINPRSIICHILPKAKNKFPEVATHILNCWYGCNSCHDRYDKYSPVDRSLMPVWPIVLKRFEKIILSLPAEKVNRAKTYLNVE
jgi:hypothetical protein